MCDNLKEIGGAVDASNSPEDRCVLKRVGFDGDCAFHRALLNREVRVRIPSWCFSVILVSIGGCEVGERAASEDLCGTEQCGVAGSCVVNDGKAVCQCRSGYVHREEVGCTDINECDTSNGGCDALTICTNTEGGRTCGECPSGYSGDGEVG